MSVSEEGSSDMKAEDVFKWRFAENIVGFDIIKSVEVVTRDNSTSRYAIEQRTRFMVLKKVYNDTDENERDSHERAVGK